MGGIVSSIADFVGDAVETVGDVVEDVGGFVVDTVETTVQAIADDPLKAAATAAAAVATGGSSLAASLGTAGAAAAGAAAASAAVDVARGEDFDDVLKNAAISGGAAYVGGEIFGTSGSTTSTGAAEFAAADAANLASQGLGSSQIAETLVASGIDDFVAADLANLASQGISSNQMASLIQPVMETPPSLLNTAQESATQSSTNQSLLETTPTIEAPEPVVFEPEPLPSQTTTQIFDDGTTLQTFDDGSLLATDTSGAVTSIPAQDLSLLPEPVATIQQPTLLPETPIVETPVEVPVVDYSTPSMVDLQGNVVPQGTLLPESNFGIQVTPPTTEFGTFNPNITSGIGIDTGAASGIEWLGGTGSLPVGTAALTAEQLATATQLGEVGTNAASGLGYLGGSESLPAGTAGITGVTTPTTLSLSDAQRGLRLANTLFGQQPQQQAGLQQRQIRPYGAVDYSPTLSLLQQRATTPNVYSLLG